MRMEIAQDDIDQALQGKFVTRVIYVEDPHKAYPFRNENGQTWFDIEPGRNPLAVADELGRPVAILRMGGRVPDQGADPNFYFRSPSWINHPPPTPAPPQPAPQ